MTMTNPVFFDAIDEALYTNGESDRLHWMTTPPRVGDRLPLGSRAGRMWEVIELCTYAGDVGELTIAHVHPVGVAVPDRAEWYATRLKARKPLASMTLHVKPDGSLHQTGCNFTGALPIVHRLLTAFDVTNHKTGSQPWGIESFDTYSPVNPEATYMAVYLTHVVAVDLTEVEGAIVLESEKVLATAQ
jgi:hypothetical protein